jgi:hypothetical protein
MTHRRSRGPKAIAELVRPALEPVVAKRGFTQASLLLDWPAIVGERLASLCQPVRLQWPPRGPKSDLSRAEPAILWLRVAAGRGLDVHYQAPALVERVNAHFGWRCVAKVAIRPEPMQPPRAARPATPPDPAAIARAMRYASSIGDEGLRQAVTRLGAAVLSQARGKRP